MSNSQNLQLDSLLLEPREALDVEYKEWLDIGTTEHKATLAKEIIALANHGGGYLIVGFRELEDGSFQRLPTGDALSAWTQDAVQSIISKYLDPAIQCAVEHRRYPKTEDRYPVIIVPGGHRIPVRAKSGSPDGKRLAPHRVYIRRPGPNSEEPKTAAEWDRFFERCLQNRQSELLEAVRSIIAGVVPTSKITTPTILDRLANFESAANERWRELVQNLPTDCPARFPAGYYDVGVAIDGNFDSKNLSELRDLIALSVRNHSGWPPFLVVPRTPFSPKAVDGTVETWIGPDADGSFDVPAHQDFWRISPEGLLFTRRGLAEDGRKYDMEPGKFFDITTSTWRIGEVILEAYYMARALNAHEADLIFRYSWHGLAGRSLVSRGNPNRHLRDGYQAFQNEFEGTNSISMNALPQALPELVYVMLKPLYELFDFFQLPKRLVDEELAELQKTIFS